MVKELGIFTVSDEGKIYIGSKELSPHKLPSGYLYVSVKRNGKQKNYYIHRLVALAFLQNPENKRTVNHKNGIKSDNRLENLEWATHSENHRHAFDILKRVQHGKKSVLQYDMNMNFIQEFVCISETGYIRSNISKACNGTYKQAYGYIWKWKK